MVPPVQLSPTKMEIDIAELSEDEEEVYECYLCYREFDSAKDIAKHCMKQNHVDIIKKDTGGERVWEFYPPPPDQTPEEFGLCNRYVNYYKSHIYNCINHTILFKSVLTRKTY